METFQEKRDIIHYKKIKIRFSSLQKSSGGWLEKRV